MHDFFPKQWLKRVKKKKIPRIIQTSDCITVWESSFLMTYPIILLKTGPHPHSIVVFLLNLAINLKSTFQISFGNGNFNWKLYLLVFAFLANIHYIRDRIDFGATSVVYPNEVLSLFLCCYWVAIDIFHSKEIKTRTTSCVSYLV